MRKRASFQAVLAAYYFAFLQAVARKAFKSNLVYNRRALAFELPLRISETTTFKEKADRMRSTIFRKLAYLPLLTLGLGLMPLASASAVSLKSSVEECQVWNFESEAKDLLKEVKYLSGKLRNDASTLESYKRQAQLSWQTHAHQLNLTREHINEIGKRLDRLQAIKSELAPWQQQAIEQIVPVTANVAAHTESAIQHLNENRTYLFAPVYTDHLTSIADGSAELKESADVFLEFGDTSDKLDRMQQKLDRLQERIGLSEL